MDRAQLEARKQQIETTFAVLNKQKAEITEEMFRLQGQHRLLFDLIEEIDNDKGEEEDVSTTEPGRAEEPISRPEELPQGTSTQPTE